MALKGKYIFQYRWDQALQVPYEGREWLAATYEKVEPGIARITLNRPEKRNAFNDRMFGDLLARRDKGLRGYFAERSQAATPEPIKQ